MSKAKARRQPAGKAGVSRATAKKASVKKPDRKGSSSKKAKQSSQNRKKASPKAKPAAPKPKKEAARSRKAITKATPKSGSAPAPRAGHGKPASPRAATKAGRTLSRVAREALTQKRAIAAALAPVADGKQIVDAYMRDVDHPFKQEMQAVREIILRASPKVSERIKWNAPSFYYKEDLGAFNPRATEYAHLILLFPDGQGMEESGLLEGNHKNRREAKFHGMDDVSKKKPALEKLVKSWVARRG